MNKLLKKRNPYGVISLTLGIISIISAIFWFISFPTSILAIIFGIKAKRMYDSNTSLAGMITGIVGVSIASIILLFLALIFVINLVY